MLCVYDKYTSQDDLRNMNCGLGILRPKSMKTRESENREYVCDIEYVISEKDAMWLYLTPWNIVRNSEGQLFVIKTVETTMSNGQSVLRASAEHISYYLADKNLQECTVTDANCHDALNHMWRRTEKGWGGTPGIGTVEYDFAFYSDIQKKASFYFDKVNPLYAIMGAENSVLSLYGGQLDRDNFTITLNSRKKGSRDNAFSIVHGINMLEIRESISVKDLCTGIVGADNYNDWKGRATKEPQFSPHEIIKHISFSYSGDSNLQHDVDKYYDEHIGPEITYEVKFKDLRQIERYKDWMALQTFNIGDRGVIRSEFLNIDTTPEIISRTVNDITGETESITLGNFRPSLWASSNRYISRDGADSRRLKALEKMQINRMFAWESD